MCSTTFSGPVPNRTQQTWSLAALLQADLVAPEVPFIIGRVQSLFQLLSLFSNSIFNLIRGARHQFYTQVEFTLWKQSRAFSFWLFNRSPERSLFPTSRRTPDSVEMQYCHCFCSYQLSAPWWWWRQALLSRSSNLLVCAVWTGPYSNGCIFL